MNTHEAGQLTQDLRLAIRRLDPDQGDRARRGARAAVRKAVRVLLRKMDEEYPAPKRKLRPRPTTAVGKARRERARWKGWHQVNAEVGAQLISAGFRLRHKTTNPNPGLYAPTWAAEVARRDLTFPLARLRAARTSRKEREALMAELELLKGGGA